MANMARQPQLGTTQAARTVAMSRPAGKNSS